MPSEEIDIGAVRAVSWDVDGTLYSTRRLTTRFWLAVLSASLKGNAIPAWRAASGMLRFRKRMEQVRANGGRLETDEASIEERVALEQAWLSPGIAALGPRPGVATALRAFRARFESQVALSDFEPTHKLASLGLLDRFDAIYSGERLGYLKPSPEPFRRVLRDLDLQPESLLHIGNRPETDGAGARAAGCRVLVLGRDFRSFEGLESMLASRDVEKRK
ncbi:MAG: HAD family hydrolase [Bryobacterales bacterium]|nr:HAD family hydrolase [Bryobacterales bacterium]